MNLGSFGFSGGGSVIIPPASVPVYGSFYDKLTQTALGVDTPTPMQLGGTDPNATSGVTVSNDGLGNPSIIEVSQTGIYNIQFSAQLFRTAGGSPEDIDIWLAINGGEVAFSDTKVSLNSNSVYLVAAWNWFTKLNPLEKLQIMWAVSDTNIVLQAEPQNLVVPHPAVPSVIATIFKVN